MPIPEEKLNSNHTKHDVARKLKSNVRYVRIHYLVDTDSRTRQNVESIKYKNNTLCLNNIELIPFLF